MSRSLRHDLKERLCTKLKSSLSQYKCGRACKLGREVLPVYVRAVVPRLCSEHDLAAHLQLPVDVCLTTANLPEAASNVVHIVVRLAKDRVVQEVE